MYGRWQQAAATPGGYRPADVAAVLRPQAAVAPQHGQGGPHVPAASPQEPAIAVIVVSSVSVSLVSVNPSVWSVSLCQYCQCHSIVSRLSVSALVSSVSVSICLVRTW